MLPVHTVQIHVNTLKFQDPAAKNYYSRKIFTGIELDAQLVISTRTQETKEKMKCLHSAASHIHF